MSSKSTPTTVAEEAQYVVTPKNKASYKGTMALAAVYSAVIVAFLLFANTRWGKTLAEDYYTFSLTMVLGMLTIVLMLIFLLLRKDPLRIKGPEKIQLVQADYKCPDFYMLRRENLNWMTSNIDSSVIANYGNKLEYRCVPMDNNAFGPKQAEWRLVGSNMALNDPATVMGSNVVYVNGAKQTPFSQFVAKTDVSKFYKAETDAQAKCGEIFPEFLADHEVKDEVTGKRKIDIRCAYANTCGTQWSSLNCP